MPILSSSKNDQNVPDNDALQTFSKSCSIVYHRINRKQFEYLQAITQIQEDVSGACNGLIKNQVDLIEEYSKGIVTHEQMKPIVEMINRYIEG
jgi:histone deacetylase complex regulatory component SIN3